MGIKEKMAKSKRATWITEGLSESEIQSAIRSARANAERVLDGKNVQKESGHEDLFALAKKQTMRSLPHFLASLKKMPRDSIETSCDFIAVAGIAAMSAFACDTIGQPVGRDRDRVMHQLILKYYCMKNKTGIRILNFDQILGPHNEDNFTSIPKSSWELIKLEAKRRLDQYYEDHERWEEEVAAWVADTKKFKCYVLQWQLLHPECPKYEDCPEYYMREADDSPSEARRVHMLEKMGVPLAPPEPRMPMAVTQDEVAQWTLIVSGYVPFGLKVEDFP